MFKMCISLFASTKRFTVLRPVLEDLIPASEISNLRILVAQPNKDLSVTHAKSSVGGSGQLSPKWLMGLDASCPMALPSWSLLPLAAQMVERMGDHVEQS